MITESKKSPLVSVWMVTYNHEKFIRQSLESVVAQKTDFAFEIVIGEDVSTDNTRAIIKEFEAKYPDIIKPVYHEKNVGPYRNAYEFVFPLLKGEYIACLEGDDYWTDEYKLQKQVDFLRNNNEYTICWTKYKLLQDSSGNGTAGTLTLPDWLHIMDNKEVFDVDLDNVFNPYATVTLTLMFKKFAFDYSLYGRLRYLKDNTLFCSCLSNGKGAILNFFGAVYRSHSGGIYSSLQLYHQRYPSFLNMEEIVKEIPGCDTPNLRHVRNILLLECFSLALEQGASTSAKQNIRKLYSKVLQYAPLNKKMKATLKLAKYFVASIRQRFKPMNARKTFVSN